MDPMTLMMIGGAAFVILLLVAVFHVMRVEKRKTRDLADAVIEGRPGHGKSSAVAPDPSAVPAARWQEAAEGVPAVDPHLEGKIRQFHDQLALEGFPADVLDRGSQPRTPALEIKIDLPPQRDLAGHLTLTRPSATLVSCIVSGRASDGAAEVNGNPDRTRTLKGGDTPTGSYRVKELRQTRTASEDVVHEYGPNGILVLAPVAGEAALAEAAGRFEIWLHGGALGEDGLRPTDGALRVSDVDMGEIVRYVAPALAAGAETKCTVDEANPAWGGMKHVQPLSLSPASDPYRTLQQRMASTPASSSSSSSASDFVSDALLWMMLSSELSHNDQPYDRSDATQMLTPDPNQMTPGGGDFGGGGADGSLDAGPQDLPADSSSQSADPGVNTATTDVPSGDGGNGTVGDMPSADTDSAPAESTGDYAP